MKPKGVFSRFSPEESEFSRFYNRKIANIKQKIIAIVLMTTLLVMVFSAVNFSGDQVQAANIGDNSNLYQDITGSDLMVSVSDSVTFSDVTAGTSTNNPANIPLVNIYDLRGLSVSWVVSGFSSEFHGTSANISNSRLNWNPSAASNYNGISGADNAKIALGGLAVLDTPRTFANGASGAQGQFAVFNALLNLAVLATDMAGSYNSTLTFTAA
jgi:hypothetical protein